MCGEGSVRGGAADLPPAASPAPETSGAAVPDVRFSDVIAELQRLSDLAAQIGGPNAYRAELLCRRTESMLRLLRAQFLGEVASTGSRGALR